MQRRPFGFERPSAGLAGLCALIAILVLAGGASRPDVPGQVVVRLASTIALVAAALFAPPPRVGEVRWVWILLLAAIALPLAQLVPLPPRLWQTLPGRAMLAGALPGQPWRPLSITPGATINAATALIVPVAVLTLATGVKAREHNRMLAVILILGALSMLVGALQFAGADANNPFVNDRRGELAGIFSNRNHFALFLALNCLIAPIWAFRPRRWEGWRLSVGFGLVAAFLFVILSTGSRAGLILGVAGTGLGVAIGLRGMKRQLLALPRWLRIAAPAGAVAVIVLFGLLSIHANRAESIKRAMAVSVDDDLRFAAFGTVTAMVKGYFPVGTGFGSFDQAFRIHEPFGLLKPTYFNRVHNDLIEVVLDGGIAGLVLLVAALGWWTYASVRVWRAARSETVILGQLGSAIILLVTGASIVDYPARTPLIMGLVALAAYWLARGTEPVIFSIEPQGASSNRHSRGSRHDAG
ncbi:O-antigen ligase family protein [Sphingomonas sp. GV3]|uniref:O-antigen ligase family protein n=1 Tax=Sphingomonas sp. GV3 TaxID=3040671 RepID=UPI00280B2562|nr:O-antigen ligase family protein [Sphingomonas sp. GV3]